MSFLPLKLLLYYCQIWICVPCSWSQKRRILADLRSSIRVYLTNHSEADITTIKDVFGTPRQIAYGVIDTLTTKEFLCQLRKDKRIVASISCFISVIVVSWMALCIYSTIEAIPHCFGTVSESIEVVNCHEITNTTESE